VGDKLSPETIKKDLRTIRAALSIAVDWRYLNSCPKMPKIDGFGEVKRFVSVEHFETILSTLDESSTSVRLPADLQCPPNEWWRALLITLWITGARIGSLLELRWDDVDLVERVAVSQPRHNKWKTVKRIQLGAATDELKKIRGFDPRVFAWNYDRTTLANQFNRLQQAAGIRLKCPGDHEHTVACQQFPVTHKRA